MIIRDSYPVQNYGRAQKCPRRVWVISRPYSATMSTNDKRQDSGPSERAQERASSSVTYAIRFGMRPSHTGSVVGGSRFGLGTRSGAPTEADGSVRGDKTR